MPDRTLGPNCNRRLGINVSPGGPEAARHKIGRESVSARSASGDGCDRLDLGIRRDAGEMILREGQDLLRSRTIKWLRHENAKGAHISYLHLPAGLHALSLIDDLSAEAIKHMKAEGFESAVIVETSSNNFQAWLNHGQVLDAATSTRAAKQLAERFGGDPSSADWRHLGRLAGFTNPKRERQLPSGIRPFARLRSATGRVYSPPDLIDSG